MILQHPPCATAQDRSHQNGNGKLDPQQLRADWRRTKSALESLWAPPYRGGIVAYGSSCPLLEEKHPLAEAYHEVGRELAKRKFGISAGGRGLGNVVGKGAKSRDQDAPVVHLVGPTNYSSTGRQREFSKKDRAYTVEFYNEVILRTHYAAGILVMEGGAGTFRQLFDALTVINIRVLPEVPVVIYGRPEFNSLVRKLMHGMYANGTIRGEILDWMHYARSPKEVAEIFAERAASSSHSTYFKELLSGFEDDASNVNPFIRKSDVFEVAVFGSAKLKPDSELYKTAMQLGFLISKASVKNAEGDEQECRIITGGGSGIMEASSLGAFKARRPPFAIQFKGLMELEPSAIAAVNVITNTFVSRLIKLLSSDAILVLPGGLGTHHEIFTLMKAMEVGALGRVPAYCLSSPSWSQPLRDYWRPFIKLMDYLLDKGLADKSTIESVKFAEMPKNRTDLRKLLEA